MTSGWACAGEGPVFEARAVREHAHTVAQAEYVEASPASGARDSRIFMRHVLPASIGPVLVQTPVDVGAIFLVLSVFTWLSNCSNPADFAGAAYPIPVLAPESPLPAPNFPEWGNLLGIGACWGFASVAGPVHWWMWTFPLLAIVGLSLSLALFFDGLDKWLRIRQ